MFHPSQVRLKGTVKGGSPGKQSMFGPAAFQLQGPQTPPRDTVSGTQSGKRVHKPINVLQVMGTASAVLYHAYTTKKHLDSVLVELADPTSSTANPTTRALLLHDVFVSKISNSIAGSAGKHGVLDNNAELVEIHFTFGKITLTHVSGKTTFSDDWSS
jgi:type VI secretion system Hcp family effector